ncbi:DNA-directed RNA polymerase sigma-70 factor [Fulvitalea axinellae]|uniref:DNA-directed RNA polymerase sigma-70 factor n=1 Tax=Fulvitalea axinellae TaxID=1182444 RepID=A0AAU9CRN1_9BACT|nr:DNA-directed RNA polymerase sigma-70 factor [Fulvitalea axinellae]
MTTREFENFLIQISARLFGFVKRYLPLEESEDALQEISVKIWEKRGRLSKMEKPEAYCFRMARNYCLKKLMRQEPFLPIDSIIENNLQGFDSGIIQLEYSETEALLFRCIDRLPIRQKEVMYMKCVDGMEYPEIATVTGLKPEHVRVLLSRARKEMKATLEKYYKHEARKRTVV